MKGLRISDNSPDSKEMSFRELDDVFLQTQTRIWLGEVLHVRLDEDVGVADLLADGELLFQVSKEVWKMLLSKHGELKHSKVHIYERTSSGNSQGRYMPYPKIDSFLKICQILGLTSIDLFSPSDAVDKRDIRRICLCIRALSKKARAKSLNVPDFDRVAYNLVMPTNLVGGIRRNLELSQCSPSSSNASSPWNDSREGLGLKIPFGEHSQLFYSGSDETESFTDLEFGSPLSCTSYNATDTTNIVGETSCGLSSVDDEIVHKTCFKNSIQSRNYYQHMDDNHDEIFAESLGFCYLNTKEMHALPMSTFSENNSALLSRGDDPYYPGKWKSRSYKIAPLISPSFTESEFECSSSFSMCSTCTEENNEDLENGISKSNFMIEAAKTSSKLKNDTEVSSKIDDELINCSYHSHQIRENLLAYVDKNMSEETCARFPVHKYVSEDIKRHCISSHDSQGDDYDKDLDALRVVESSEFLAYSVLAERIPSFDFFHNDLFPRSRDNVEIKGENLQTAYVLPSSNHDFREGKETTSDKSLCVKKVVVSYIQDAFSEPYNVSQAILDSTVYPKETSMEDEPGGSNDKEDKTVGKSRNQVLKSVTRIMTIVGAIFFFLHVRRKKDEDKINGTVVPLQVQKQNQKFINRRKIKVVKSNSLYPGQKFNF